MLYKKGKGKSILVTNLITMIENTVNPTDVEKTDEVSQDTNQQVESTATSESAEENKAETTLSVAQPEETKEEQTKETAEIKEVEAAEEKAEETTKEEVEAVEEKAEETTKEEVEAVEEKAEDTAEQEAETAEKEAEKENNAKQTDEENPTDTPKNDSEQQKDISKLDVDFSNHSKEELIELLQTVITEYKIFQIKDLVEGVKVAFYKIHKAENAQKRKEFIDKGGNPEDFKVEQDPLEQELKKLYKQYKNLKIKHNEKIEEAKQNNLKEKYKIIEDIEKLTLGTESLNKTFDDFKELQQRWREIGAVPQTEMKNLWETYNYRIEKFYDYIKINKELRDLDFRRNLESKIELCENAEELLLEPNIIKAFKELQKCHSDWREIGPVPREKREEIWERFKEVTTKINKKHQEYFEKKKEEEQNNLKAKIMLCEKAEEVSALDIKTHREWDEKSKEIVEVQKIWKLIGYAPKKESNKIYSRFREACDNFFNRKREYYSNIKEEQENNLQKKTELCIQAEALKDSTDWRKTTDEYIKIQNDWKEIGPVSRKHSDTIWKRFRTACNYFFDKKKEFFSGIDEEQSENLRKKKELIEKVRNFQPSENENENMTALKEFQKVWMQIGHVPFKNKDEVQKEFRQELNKHFDKLQMDVSKRQEINFISKIKNIQQSGKPQVGMRRERDKIVQQIERIKNDISLLENNIGFFNNSKNAESLIKDVQRKIERAKKQEKELKEKLKIMDKYSEK